MSAVPASAQTPRSQADIEWAEIAAAAPQMADTKRRYLRQSATFLAPASVESADGALRIFARWADSVDQHVDARSARGCLWRKAPGSRSHARAIAIA